MRGIGSSEMAVRARRRWRASRGTLVLLTVFAVAAGIGVPAVAYLVYLKQHSWVVPGLLVALAVGALVYAWRFGLHPRLDADEQGVHVVNPRRRASLAWDEITVLAPGENGLVIASDETRIEAWCVQKSNWATDRGRRSRSDDVVAELADLRDVHDPPLEDDETGIRIRRARCDEADLLTQIERSSNEIALAHVFPPEEFAYPSADVHDRWYRLLRTPQVQIRVLERDDEPIGLIAFEPTGRIRHLAVDPEHTREGHGSLLLEYACEEIFDNLHPEATLWVLEANHPARSFYAANDWRETTETMQSEFPPYPDQIKLRKPNPSAPRRGR